MAIDPTQYRNKADVAKAANDEIERLNGKIELSDDILSRRPTHGDFERVEKALEKHTGRIKRALGAIRVYSILHDAEIAFHEPSCHFDAIGETRKIPDSFELRLIQMIVDELDGGDLPY